MKTIRNLIAVTLLVTGAAFASTFPEVKAPPSSDGKAIVNMQDNKVGALPDWLAGIYLNEEDIIVVGDMHTAV
jgi:hypothetical protein